MTNLFFLIQIQNTKSTHIKKSKYSTDNNYSFETLEKTSSNWKYSYIFDPIRKESSDRCKEENHDSWREDIFKIDLISDGISRDEHQDCLRNECDPGRSDKSKMWNKYEISDNIDYGDDRIDREHFSLFCSCDEGESEKWRYKVKKKDKCNNLEGITTRMAADHGMDIFIVRYQSDNINTI